VPQQAKIFMATFQKFSMAKKRTKGETLLWLQNSGITVPALCLLSERKWINHKSEELSKIRELFQGELLAVRSSAIGEDSDIESMAGYFDSEINVPFESVEASIERVFHSYQKNPSFTNDGNDQVIIQKMVGNIMMSGVITTRPIDDGAPYFVLNFDDKTGKTDSVTSGSSINKTMYVYHRVNEESFDTPVFWKLIKAVKQVQLLFRGDDLDIEFAIDNNEVVHILQARPITTSTRWDLGFSKLVENRINHLGEFIDSLSKPREHILGNRTLLGIMPDWNPAEMIGVIPNPLARSLYRKLITQEIWREARAAMGYKQLSNVELMVSLYGRTYIDVRNSFNSFLPKGLDNAIGSKLIEAQINYLDKHPHLHDKVEFDVAFTCFEFDLQSRFRQRFPGVLSEDELSQFNDCLLNLLKGTLSKDAPGSVKRAMGQIDKLNHIQRNQKHLPNSHLHPFQIIDEISQLISECKEFGTKPFSIIARHGFVAESLLRSLARVGVFSASRTEEFKRSVQTVAGTMRSDTNRWAKGEIGRQEFMREYGHLRPSSYDVYSLKMSDRTDFESGEGIDAEIESVPDFELTPNEILTLETLLQEHGVKNLAATELFEHFAQSISGREYAKFIFTRHLSRILELIAQWGETHHLSRQDMSMIEIEDLLKMSFSPFTSEIKNHFKDIIEQNKIETGLAKSLKLSYLIRDSRDVIVAPMHRNIPNFIGNGAVEGEVIFLNAGSDALDLSDKIVCIEGADPGYDWIFSKGILALITMYGGVNSHMAIRCAELGLNAAIGCGEQPIQLILQERYCILNCDAQTIKTKA